MIHDELKEFEIAPPEVVRQAACDFAAALAATHQFIHFERCAERLKKDGTAQKGIADYQEKQQSLQMMLRLNAVSPEDQAELERLQGNFRREPAVIAYLQAQSELVEICQAAGDIISHAIGLNYAATCGGGCCG